MKKILSLLLIFSLHVMAQEKKDMIFYIGITMVKPVMELAKNFEQSHNCTITILQGGSQDLYDSAKLSQKGDLYLPGSISYRKNHLNDGILLDAKFVGYNKLAIVVKKGNPKNIPSDLSVLASSKYRVVLGNQESGSVGSASKKTLTKFGNYEEVILNALYLAPDSRNITKSIKDGDADVTLNWYATTFWDDNKDFVEPIVLDEKYAPKNQLVFNLLKSSAYPDLAKEFMEYASSKEGRAVFAKYGFLDENDLKNFDKVKFE